jgi:hypothetical protein
MAEGQSRSDVISGLGPPARPAWTAAETLAAAASVLWLVVVLVVSNLPSVFGSADDPLRPVMVTVTILMPIALIWIAARAARAARDTADDVRRLNFALSSLRQSMLADRQARAIGAAPPPPKGEGPAPLPAGGQVRVQPRPPGPAAPLLHATDAPTVSEDQPSLALGGEADDDNTALSPADFIRALHFPNDVGDEAGFAALRLALRDRRTRQLIQASQDVLTLLSQDGIYMDDLASDRSRPELWRRFARGERGGAISGLGAAQDRDSVGIAMGRLREDAVFRDAVHHFLRLFDRHLSAFEPLATDEDLVHLAETRTARAFTLLGRVAGIFD